MLLPESLTKKSSHMNYFGLLMLAHTNPLNNYILGRFAAGQPRPTIKLRVATIVGDLVERSDGSTDY